MRRLLHITVVLWHLFVIGCLFYLIGLMRPSRGAFLRRQLWVPVTNWVKLGRFFEFTTGRAALLFFLTALATAILILLVYLLRRQSGWVLMFGWNLVAAINFVPSSWMARQASTAAALAAIFAAMAVASFLARPRYPS